jgi:hypothetical protein
MARLIRRPVRPMRPHRKIDNSHLSSRESATRPTARRHASILWCEGRWERSASCGTRSNTLGKRRRTVPRGLRMPPIPIFVNSSSGCVIRGSARRTAPNLLPVWISISTRWSAVRREFPVIDPSVTRTNSGSIRPSQARRPSTSPRRSTTRPAVRDRAAANNRPVFPSE